MHKLVLFFRTFVAFNEETGVNVTAKSNPTMLLVKVNIESGDVVSFSHPNQAKLYVSVPQSDSEKRTCLWVQFVNIINNMCLLNISVGKYRKTYT